MNNLECLKQWTVVVADTSDLGQVAQYRPQDATTNPSLVLRAVQKSESAALVSAVRDKYAKSPVDEVLDRLLVKLGCEILALIPGRVSTEVDARLSFDVDQTVKRAERLSAMYASEGVDASRVLIKIAATWEGIQAASVLERRGIRTNLTLLFNFAQALSCAHAGAQLISPFVGRIYDWHKKTSNVQWVESEHAGPLDPGVQSVTKIYRFFKAHSVRTEIMGASFRNVEQIKALAGCDLLTISPELLRVLSTTGDAAQEGEGAQAAELKRVLSPVVEPEQRGQSPALNRLDEHAPQLQGLQLSAADALRKGLSEPDFRLTFNEDAMASEMLAQGVRAFCADSLKLESLLRG